MQAGVCLRQDTETTLPELTEQHRIRQKEEELGGLESVHMAESETECAAPGLNTLEPECVTAHSGVSDVHHTHTSVIKTEADLGSTHTGDNIMQKYHAGVAVKNRIAGLRQAKCSYSEIYKTLKAEEIPISLSAIKRIGQRFETTGNVARKKGSGRPKASSCRDDHLLKFTVLKDRKRSLQKLSAEFKTSENKTLSRRTITRRLSNAGFVYTRC